jgi:dTDP-4-dehydrorhamnose reductase
MILLLGADGYLGQAFACALRQREQCFIPLSRGAFDYTRFEFLFDYIRKIKPAFVINAVDCPPISEVAGAESDRMEMLRANTLLPQTVARACGMTNTPWGQVSSGSVYAGAKVLHNQCLRIEKDLTQPTLRKAFESHPEIFFGFKEGDEPNCSFNTAPCSFYSGTRALAEDSIRHHRQNYIWRLRLPFNEKDQPSNFLSQLQHSPFAGGAINSLSHLEDCVAACLELWERQAPFGIYHVTNPGAVDTDQIVEMVRRIRKPAPHLQIYVNGRNRRNGDPVWPEGNCVLDTSKLFRAGVKLRPVQEALEASLQKWQPRAIVASEEPGLSVSES